MLEAVGGGFGAISEQFGDKKEQQAPKQVTVQIAEGNMYSSKSVRDLIKAISEEIGNNVIIQAA